MLILLIRNDIAIYGIKVHPLTGVLASSVHLCCWVIVLSIFIISIFNGIRRAGAACTYKRNVSSAIQYI